MFLSVWTLCSSKIRALERKISWCEENPGRTVPTKLGIKALQSTAINLNPLSSLFMFLVQLRQFFSCLKLNHESRNGLYILRDNEFVKNLLLLKKSNKESMNTPQKLSTRARPSKWAPSESCNPPSPDFQSAICQPKNLRLLGKCCQGLCTQPKWRDLSLQIPRENSFQTPCLSLRVRFLPLLGYF